MNEPQAAYIKPDPYISVAVMKYTENGQYWEQFKLGIEDAQTLYETLGKALLAAGVQA